MMKRTTPMQHTPSRAKEAAQTIAPRSAKKPEPSRGLLPSGSTLLNCALSDNYKAGIGAGKVINIVGDSSAGKTLLALTMLAEIAHDPKYNDYTLILDDVEQANEFGLEGLFGKKTAKRVEAPVHSRDGEPIYSETVEQFFANIMRRIRAGERFVYILDSLDALTDSSEHEQAGDLVKQADDAMKKASKDDDDDGPPDISMPGTYGMAKSKLMSQILRTITAGLANSGSVLVIISQTRDAINARPGQETKRRAGGRALQFYCSNVVWLSVVKTLKGGKKESQKIIGHRVSAKIKKNKLTGKERTISFDTYHSYGVDDLGSCIDFLSEQGVFKKKGAFLDVSELGGDFAGKNWQRKDLLKAIEEDEYIIKKLRYLVGQAWEEEEESLDLGRKPRFES